MRARSGVGTDAATTVTVRVDEVRRVHRSAGLRTVIVAVLLAAVGVVVLPSVRASATTTRTPVILDTDMYSSADDVGAEATLFAYDLMGQDNVIAVGVNTRTSRPQVATDSWKCAAAIAQFYGYPNVPIGADMPDNGPAPSTNNFIGPCAALASANTKAPGSAVEVYRKALAAQPDGSVVIVCTGYEENIDNLLRSSPDSYSPLNGAQLVAKKVSELVMMGGAYPTSEGENNFEGDAGAAADVAENWPTKIVYSGEEVGSNVLTGETVSSVHPADSPVRVALEAFAGASHAITSFDVTAAYHAIDPSDPNLSEVGPGTNAIGTYGTNTFTTGPGNEYYLQLGDATELESSIETLWDTLPGTTHQTITFTSTPPSPATLGGTYAASASGGATGNPVTLTIDAASTSGCTISSSGVVALSLPAGSCIVDANEPGDTTYAPAVAQQTFQVTKVAQAISYTSTPPTSPVVGDTYDVSATGGGSSNAVTFSIDASSTSGCTVSGGTVTFSAPLGTCVIDANQAGNGTYAAAAQVQQTIGVGGVAQTISFTSTPPSPARVGGAPYTPTAMATSGLAVVLSLDPTSTGCTLANGAVTFTSVGTCVVDASQAGSSTYLSATQQQTIPIMKGASVVTVTSTPPSSARAGGTYVPSATDNTGDAIGITLGAHSAGCGMLHGTLELRAVGTCVVDFTDPGDANYVASTASQQFVISKGHVTEKVAATPSTVKAGSALSLSATVSTAYATGVVTFRVGTTVLCTAAVRGGTATCRAQPALSRGSYRVVATYSGSSSFLAATGSTVIRLT